MNIIGIITKLNQIDPKIKKDEKNMNEFDDFDIDSWGKEEGSNFFLDFIFQIRLVEKKVRFQVIGQEFCFDYSKEEKEYIISKI